MRNPECILVGHLSTNCVVDLTRFLLQISSGLWIWVLCLVFFFPNIDTKGVYEKQNLKGPYNSQ